MFPCEICIIFKTNIYTEQQRGLLLSCAMLFFYTRWKHQKIISFLTFPLDAEGGHWIKKGWYHLDWYYLQSQKDKDTSQWYWVLLQTSSHSLNLLFVQKTLKKLVRYPRISTRNSKIKTILQKKYLVLKLKRRFQWGALCEPKHFVYIKRISLDDSK